MKKTILTLGFIVAAYVLKAQVMYGTTSAGGTNNGGAICKLATTNNTLTAAFSFDAADGKNPGYSKLLEASDGKLYGMTSAGGSSDAGIIFSYDPATLSYKQLKDFDITNGGYPYGSLLQALDGKLYGMTKGGGAGAGVIFSFDPATSAYTKLIDFDYINGGTPLGSLMQASDGKLYGMTLGGGIEDNGVIFSFDPGTSTYTKLEEFDYTNGSHPYGDLLQASDGKLYGMTQAGGSGVGVIFSFDPTTSTYIKLLDFDYINGAYPSGSLTEASDGKLYGMTNDGGSNGGGVIFSYDPAASAYTKLKDFDGTNGSYPTGSLIQATDGNLYGMTSTGGSDFFGVIFSYDPVTSIYTKLKDLNASDGDNPSGTLTQAVDEKLYGMTTYGGSSSSGAIFSYDPVISAYAKLRDFGLNNTGNYIRGGLIKSNADKLYGMSQQGGSYGAGTIFSFDANTSVFTKLKDFDLVSGANPEGSLMQASNGKLYGMTREGGSSGYGVIFFYDPATATYAKLKDFDNTTGGYPSGSLMQASDGKLYGMTQQGGSSGNGVIFSYDPATATYAKLKDFDNTTGGYPTGSLMQASDGKLYGMTSSGGNYSYGVIFSYDPATSVYTKLVAFYYTNGANPYGSLIQASDGKLYGMASGVGSPGYGVIFSFDPTTSTYIKLVDFDYINGAYPYGSLVQASDGKLYGMTWFGGSNNYGVAFSYNISTSTYTKLNDFIGDNGSQPQFTSFTELSDTAGIQIFIADRSVIEGNRERKFIFLPLELSERSPKEIVRVHYTTQNNTATAASDYIAQSGTLVFPPGLKKIILPIRIKGDETPETNETFSIILNDPVNATITDSSSIVTILNDDASTSNAEQKNIHTISSISLSPNPAQDKVNVMIKGYNRNVIIQLSSFDGRILQQQRLQILSSKSAQYQMNVGSYGNGTYLVTAVDEKGNRQTEKLVIHR